MGWASGSHVFAGVIKAVRAAVTDEDTRVQVYKGAIKAFEEGDWDTQSECCGMDPAFDRALRELHPKWFADENAR
jgi:hypothetical protein